MMGGMRIIEYIEFRSLAVPEEFGAGAVFVVGLSWPYKHAGHSRSCSRAAAASSGSEFRGRTERKRRGRSVVCILTQIKAGFIQAGQSLKKFFKCISYVADDEMN